MLYDWFYLQSVWKNSKKLNVIKKIHKDYKKKFTVMKVDLIVFWFTFTRKPMFIYPSGGE